MRSRPALAAVTGVVAGLVWFLTLSAAAVHEGRTMTQGTSPWPATAAVVVTGALCVLGVRAWGRRWGAGVSGALGVCLLLGLVEGPIHAGEAGPLFSLPATFSVGLGSVTTWLAFAVAVTLTLTARASGSDGAHAAGPEGGRRPGTMGPESGQSGTPGLSSEAQKGPHGKEPL